MPSEKSSMRSWLDRQSHLPKDIDDSFLDAFVYSCYNDLEKAKVALNLFCKIRASFIEVISDRDPLSPHIQKELKIVNPARYQISGNRILFVWKIDDPGLENYDYPLDLKLFCLALDAWFLDDYKCCDGEIVLFDVKDICPKILATLSLSLIRKALKYCQEALPVRLKQVHMVNVPPFAYNLFGMIKPFLKKEIIDIINFHQPMTDTLNQFLSKGDLPEDYGGNLPSTDAQKLKTISLFMDKREALMKILWVATEKEEDETMDMGSFRTIDID